MSDEPIYNALPDPHNYDEADMRRAMMRMQALMDRMPMPDSYRDDGTVITLLRNGKPYGFAHRGWFYEELAKPYI